MNLNDINAITSNLYGFRVFDWDNNRGEGDGAGPILLGKVDLKDPEWTSIFHGTADPTEIDNLSFRVAERGLEGMSDKRIAHIFSRIIERFENIEFKGVKYLPTSIHLRVTADNKVPAKPFLFILGTADKISSTI